MMGLKKKIPFVILVLLMTSGLIFFWPLSFLNEIEDNSDMLIYITAFEIKDGVPVNTTTDYSVLSGHDSHMRIQQILRGYQFRRSFRTLFGSGTIHGNIPGYNLSVYSGDKNIMFLNGTGEIFINSRIYRMGLYGDMAALRLMDEIRDVFEVDGR